MQITLHVVLLQGICEGCALRQWDAVGYSSTISCRGRCCRFGVLLNKIGPRLRWRRWCRLWLLLNLCRLLGDCGLLVVRLWCSFRFLVCCSWPRSGLFGQLGQCRNDWDGNLGCSITSRVLLSRCRLGRIVCCLSRSCRRGSIRKVALAGCLARCRCFLLTRRCYCRSLGSRLFCRGLMEILLRCSILLVRIFLWYIFARSCRERNYPCIGRMEVPSSTS